MKGLKMMYKLLLVDDEPIERSTLALIISRCYENIEIVGEASNGREAILKAELLNPDIIIMDIKMPGINGIEAAQVIRAHNRSVKVIIVTAYDYFEYAKESIKIGIDDFLLKPVLKEDVQDSIDKILSKINNEKRQKQLDENIVQKLKELSTFIECELISSILLNLEEEQIKEYFNLLDIKFNLAYGIIVNLDESELPEYITEGIRRKVYNKRIYEKVALILNDIGIKYISAGINDWLYILVLMERQDSDYNQKMFSLHVLNILQEHVKKEFNVFLNIGVGMAYSSITKLFDSMLEAKIALGYNSNSTQGIHFGDINVKIHYGEYPYNDEKHLCDKIIKGDTNACLPILDKLLKWIMVNCESLIEIRQKLFEIAVMITRSATIFEHLDGTLLDTSKYFEEIKNIQSMNEIQPYMARIVKDLVEAMSKVRKLNTNEKISKSVEFITKNYDKDITLEDVAKAVSLSSFYFSKLFKQETGENFIDYLTRFRMTMAEALLKDKNSIVKNVSFRVGYNDPNYFSKLFKKYYGVSPSEYKESVKF